MAHYRATMSVSTPPEVAFDYLADFANTQEWDPGVVRAEAVTPGPVGDGSEFDVDTRSVGRPLRFRYRIIEHLRPRRVVLRGTTSRLVSTDTIEVSADPGGGSAVTYDADLRLTGPWRALDPLLALAFRRIGDRAVDGLRARLGVPAGHRS